MGTFVVLGLAAVAAVVAVTSRASSQPLPLRLVTNVPLPGPSNRFDYTSLDPTSGRLYIAHMNASQLPQRPQDGEFVLHAVTPDG